jgi:hypothetical protein
MASTYVNDLRLNEMATGDASGSWGTVTNTNLELIGEAFSYGTETIGDADSTLTIADGAADAARSFYLKITSSVDLTTTRIVTLGPNTVSKVWMIENATTGSQVITIKQGSGATINVPNGQVKMISTDGAGSGGAVLDLLVDVDLTGTTTLVNLDVSGAVDIAGDLTLSAGGDGALRFTAASSVKVLDNNAAALVFEEADNAYMTFVTTDGSEAVKFDKALDINAATQIDATVTVGVDDTGYDVKFFGATAGAYMLWDESADDLILGGAAGLSVNSTALVTGVLTTTAATVSNGGGQFNGGIVVGVDDTGYDVKMFGATSGKYMEWDASEDILFFRDNTAIRMGNGSDVNLFSDGANFVIDATGDIILDADGGDISIKDGGVEKARLITGNAGFFDIYSPVSDQDVRIRGLDGASVVTALTLDMSSAGAATFNTSVLLSGTGGLTTTGGNNLTVSGSVLNHAGLIFATQAILPAQEGAEAAANVIDIGANGNEFKSLYLNTSIINDAGFTLDSGGDIVLDAGGSDILLQVSGTTFGSLRENSSNFRIKSDVSDKDILFLGNDGGVEITALTLDMSAAGAATFNAGAVFNDAVTMQGAITTIGSAAGGTNVQLNINGVVSRATRIQFQESGVNRWLLGQGAASETSAFELYNTDGTIALSVNKTTNAATFSNDVTINGALSKSSGSFKIDHPLPSKTETHNLVHSFIEGPQADNIYRGKVALVDGSATVNIDDVAGMTDGTFAVLNREVQCFTSNETGWTAVRGSVSGNILTIEAQDASCTDTISWMVIGERQDKHMYDTEWTDENGKVIVEPLKEK